MNNVVFLTVRIYRNNKDLERVDAHGSGTVRGGGGYFVQRKRADGCGRAGSIRGITVGIYIHALSNQAYCIGICPAVHELYVYPIVVIPMTHTAKVHPSRHIVILQANACITLLVTCT